MKMPMIPIMQVLDIHITAVFESKKRDLKLRLHFWERNLRLIYAIINSKNYENVNNLMPSDLKSLVRIRDCGFYPSACNLIHLKKLN